MKLTVSKVRRIQLKRGCNVFIYAYNFTCWILVFREVFRFVNSPLCISKRRINWQKLAKHLARQLTLTEVILGYVSNSARTFVVYVLCICSVAKSKMLYKPCIFLSVWKGWRRYDLERQWEKNDLQPNAEAKPALRTSLTWTRFRRLLAVLTSVRLVIK